jgi:hypothetical protein
LSDERKYHPADLGFRGGYGPRNDPIMDHDAGGKVKLPLQAGVRGAAQFHGPSDCYRLALYRDWGTEDVPIRARVPLVRRYLLCIGMNPSTAAHDIDDPTIRWELDLTRRLGLERYVKCNVSPYRCTHPKLLSAATVELCPDINLRTIIEHARIAEKVVATWGKLPQPLRAAGDCILFEMRSLQIPVWCLGKNADGSPKHPLYLKRDTPLERFQ